MKIHILGICGTFMGGIALLARELGHDVSGSDANVYPPMSEQLSAAGITLSEGYSAAHLDPAPDLVIVGNALSRGNAAVERLLDTGLPYTSGPRWLAEHVLRDRHVVAVAGTHGKTTTTALLAWMLERGGLDPGFLIGGVAAGLDASARLGRGRCFVVEADEYDTAFFDKRSKFIHYMPRTLILTNLEYDHADIFADIGAIRREFHNLLRTVPGNGLIVAPHKDAEIDTVLEMGCWTPVQRFSLNGGPGEWRAKSLAPDWSEFELRAPDAGTAQTVRWGLYGAHNAANAVAAAAAAASAGLEPAAAAEGAASFGGVRRRLERLGEVGGIGVYDDFAHHPTAIAATLGALRARTRSGRILALLEPRSNTMKLGVHGAALAGALAAADRVFVYRPAGLEWDLAESLAPLGDRCRIFDAVPALVGAAVEEARETDHLLIMSNGGFDKIQQRLLAALGERWS